MRAVGYCRVSTDEQGESGLGLADQKHVIQSEVDRRGWDFQTMYADVASGKSMKRRPDLTQALAVLANGEADVLVVAKLDRLSRSVSDFAAVLALTAEQGWALDVCDLGVDTTTPSGKMVAQIMMVLAEWEREMIGLRTRSALSAAKARGQQLGRKSTVDPDTLRLIRLLRDSGKSYRQIAATLAGEGVATPQGGSTWHAASVRHLYLSQSDAA